VFPKDFRRLRIKPGTQIGLIGDYNASSIWSNDEQVTATLDTYLVVERRLAFTLKVAWDTASIASLSVPLNTISMNEERCVVSALLLTHRYSEMELEGFAFQEKYFPPWEHESTVLVYGLRLGESLGSGPLRLTDWEPKTERLSGAAHLTIEESFYPSPLAFRILHHSNELKDLGRTLNAGLITVQEYEVKKASAQAELASLEAEWNLPSCEAIA
jgi:hypothetical protein